MTRERNESKRGKQLFLGKIQVELGVNETRLRGNGMRLQKSNTEHEGYKWA